MMLSGSMTAFNWQEALKSWHNEDPGMTPALLTDYLTNEEVSSYDALIAMAGDIKGKTVLDLACGDGAMTARLLDAVGPKGRIIGVDMSEGELNKARDSIKDSRVEFIQAEAQSMPLENQSIDVVFSHLALMLMNPIDPVLEEISRVLKSGGALYAVTIPCEHQGNAVDFFSWYLERVMELLEGDDLPEMGDTAFHDFEGIQKLFAKHDSFEAPTSETKFTYQFVDPPEKLWQNLLSFYIPRILGKEKMAKLTPHAIEKLKIYQDESGKVTLPFGARRFKARKVS